MNNEEKILSILEQIQMDIVSLKQGQVETNRRLDKLEEDVLEIKEDLDMVSPETNSEILIF